MDSFWLVTQTVFKNLPAAMPMRHTALPYSLRSSVFSTVAGLTMLGSFSGCGLDAKASIPAQVQAAAYVAAHGPSVEAFVPPPSPHMDYSFNPGWKFTKGDVTNADQIAFDDAPWVTVSAPHTYNDVDSYTDFISHSGGDRHAYSGIAWYRKHFKLPASAKDGKVWLEFEGLKQAGRFWVNGKFAGKYENGVTPLGLDVTELVNFGDGQRHRREGG